jgi:hypothetical protein
VSTLRVNVSTLIKQYSYYYLIAFIRSRLECVTKVSILRVNVSILIK